MNDTLTISPTLDHFQVDIPADIQLARKSAIECAQEIVQVTNQSELDDAIAAASLCKSLEKSCESAREQIKKPVLEAGRRIDSVAKGFASGLANERTRIEKLAASYQAKVNAAAEALKREELAAMAASTDMSEDAMRFRASRSAELAQIEKPSGAQFRSFTDYMELDPVRLLMLANARPDLVTIEVKRRELLAYLSIPNHAPLPGIVEFQNNTLHAKAS